MTISRLFSYLTSIALLLVALLMEYAAPTTWTSLEKTGGLIALLLIMILVIQWSTLSYPILGTLCILALHAVCPAIGASQIWFVLFWLTSFISLACYLSMHRQPYPITTIRWLNLLSALCYLVGLCLRWQESYALHIGHLPIGTLYEVLLLLSFSTLMLYIYIEEQLQNHSLGSYALSLVCLIHLFTLWYAYSREAYVLSPLIPALQSYWLQLHVPMNFIGYGLFGLASVISMAYLLPWRRTTQSPTQEQLELTIIHCIRWGLLFFTIAILLGALWASETWGSYWQWDPKESWALIVWLNYAAWLHALRSRLKTRIRILWSCLSFFVTAFAFLGVNIGLSGLHTYGQL